MTREKRSITVLLLIALPALPLTIRSQPKYEFRAAWMATVGNIDWPSKKGLPADSQRAEFIRQLDMHQRLGFNAIVAQIRPAADAFFPSPFEPWSEWLSGKQGTPPSPYYDPLQFMIEETHKRGMEFHAWCNPYRAVFSIARSSIAANHITRRHPEWFLTYGSTLYFDPGNKEVQQYVTSVIRDMVHRYDIDAVHFDDYFYPYRITGKEFPDNASFKRYGNGLSKEDWRRSNVDSVILMLSRAIKEEKPHCKFGISPFGIWRNKTIDPEGSDTQAGQTNYDDLFADILLWLRNGWIDYVVPQIYFEFEHSRAPYGVLLDWWAHHSYGRQCYIGIGVYRAGSNPAWRDLTQLPRQVRALRTYPDVHGAVFFSSKDLEKDPFGWSDSLQLNFFNYPALIPPMRWIDSTTPAGPVIRVEASKKDATRTVWLAKGASQDTLRGFAIYKAWSPSIDIDSSRAFKFIPYDPVASFEIDPESLPPAKGPYYFVTAVSRTNNESDPVPIILSNFAKP